MLVLNGMKPHRPLFRPLIILSLFGSLVSFVGCAPSSGTDPLKTQPTAASTPTTEKPALYREEGVEVVRGGVHSDHLEVKYDEVSKGMTLKGQLQLTPFDGGPLAVLDISLAGTVDGQRISLKPLPGDKTTTAGMNVAAKATCIDEAGGCAASFIDIYVQYNDHIYHHQIETSANSKTPTSPYLPPIDNKPVKPTPVVDLDKEDDLTVPQRDDNNEPIEDDDDDSDGQQGRYIGDIKG